MIRSFYNLIKYEGFTCKMLQERIDDMVEQIENFLITNKYIEVKFNVVSHIWLTSNPIYLFMVNVLH
jgi:hypothetical protein